MTREVLTSAEKDIQYTVLIKTNFSDFREKIQSSLAKWEAICLKVVLRRKESFYLLYLHDNLCNQSVKYITCYLPDGKSTINHCCHILLQMIIIIGKYIAIQTELRSKTYQFITCPFWRKICEGHAVPGKSHSSTIGNVLMKNYWLSKLIIF